MRSQRLYAGPCIKGQLQTPSEHSLACKQQAATSRECQKTASVTWACTCNSSWQCPVLQTGLQEPGSGLQAQRCPLNGLVRGPQPRTEPSLPVGPALRTHSYAMTMPSITPLLALQGVLIAKVASAQ